MAKTTNYIYQNSSLNVQNRKNNGELELQTNIVTYLRLSGVLVFSVPNGVNISNPVTRKLNKYAGCLSGVSDLIILTKKCPYFIEIKTKKGRQSPNQKEFQQNIEKLGYTYQIWREIEDAEKFLKNKI